MLYCNQRASMCSFLKGKYPIKEIFQFGRFCKKRVQPGKIADVFLLNSKREEEWES